LVVRETLLARVADAEEAGACAKAGAARRLTVPVSARNADTIFTLKLPLPIKAKYLADRRAVQPRKAAPAPFSRKFKTTICGADAVTYIQASKEGQGREPVRKGLCAKNYHDKRV
jgi:hypothetical protein